MARPIRCGWCINGDHANCAVAIRTNTMTGSSRFSVMATQIWRCPCEECDARSKVRCTECKRRDVPVTEMSACVDVEDCDGYRATRRAEIPSFQMMDELEQARADSKGERAPRRLTPAKPREGACICCGEPTKGGKFLPGHDSRYVQSQARAYLAAAPGPDQGAIYDKMESLSPALHAKWVKAIERIKTNDAKAKAEADAK